jgi:Type IV secretion system pilin
MKKKSIKVILAGILTVPIMALELTFAGAMSQPVSAVNFNTGAAGGASSAQGAGQPSDLFGNGGVFQKVTNIALYLIGAVSVLMLIYGGIRYTLSGGDSKNVTAAKNTILYAIVGIVVAILAFAIVNFVITSLSPVA